MAASENRFAPKLNEKEVIEILEKHKESQSIAWKYFKVETWKLFFDNLSIRVSQRKTAMQVEAIYTFKNYLYIVTSGFFSQNKVEKICLISWGRFYK